MRAGDLNKRVTFERMTRVPDGGGGWTQAWGDPLTVWAQFSPERGRERIKAGRVADAMAGVLRIRSSTQSRALTPSHRVTVDGMVWNVRAIANPDQRNVMLEMTVERDGGQG